MNSYSMMKKLLFFIYVLTLLSSCSLVGKDKQGDNNVVTPVQETMMSKDGNFLHLKVAILMSLWV